MSALSAWNLIEELFQDERVDFVAEPAGIDSRFPLAPEVLCSLPKS